jgi:hypothetical protein
MLRRFLQECRLELGAHLRAIARIATAGAFFVAFACMNWVGMPIKTVPSAPTNLRLHLRDGSSLIVRKAVVSADSIVGIPWGSAPEGSRIAVARTKVERVDVGETDQLRTTGLLLGILAIPVGTLVWLAKHFRDP